MVHLLVLSRCRCQHLWAPGASPFRDVLSPWPRRPYRYTFSDRHRNFPYHVEGSWLASPRAGRLLMDSRRDHFALLHSHWLDSVVSAAFWNSRIQRIPAGPKHSSLPPRACRTKLATPDYFF